MPFYQVIDRVGQSVYGKYGEKRKEPQQVQFWSIGRCVRRYRQGAGDRCGNIDCGHEWLSLSKMNRTTDCRPKTPPPNLLHTFRTASSPSGCQNRDPGFRSSAIANSTSTQWVGKSQLFVNLD